MTGIGKAPGRLARAWMATVRHVKSWLKSKTMWLGALVAAGGVVELLNAFQQNLYFFAGRIPNEVMGLVHVGLAMAIWAIRYRTTKPLLEKSDAK